MTVLILALASSTAWFISSLIGGGSPLILIPLITLCLSTAAIPPVITTGMLFGNAQRVGLYWQHIEWRLVAW
ncbi:MAG: sulfite exporter TauE/SafE family protein, partial [Spirulinaceae cyanobacterium]